MLATVLLGKGALPDPSASVLRKCLHCLVACNSRPVMFSCEIHSRHPASASDAAEDLAFEPRPSASGFLEGINAFEETACRRAECQAKSGESSELKGVHRGNRSFTPVADSAFAEGAFSG